MAERSKALVSKTSWGEIPSEVQILPPPPSSKIIMTEQILIYISLAFGAIAIGWIVYFELRLRRVFGGRKASDLEDIMKEIVKELEDVDNFRGEMEKYLESVERRLRRSAQHVGVVRFNPFHDAGGDQSFSIAIMDEKKNGIVLSSLYGRETSRLYAKPLENASSRYKLSKEEEQAIGEALNKNS
ncbi:MAG: hypothetical protein UX24_C0032G0016 [Candidatus Giovannonibacteria bacterium GW2011_GWB1_45_9b]|uniref:DUF4446 domain-containing protein n=3 Tax=Candidatus Giovannoniibacteriota TaxID=1752738 RepID=A0A0G1QD62_9BACT|nr:MAG: hypothetical protein UX24_C0032G0016 [Candidatus Giovannonibacteria bacterium GW2011_GWB1_45_9b]